MDMELNEDQVMLVDALRSLGEGFQNLPAGHERDYACWSKPLETALREGGFLAAGRDAGWLEAALVVMEMARLPVVTTAMVSALAVPQVTGRVLDGSATIIRGDTARAHRFLGVADYALVALEDDVALVDLRGREVAPVKSVFAYPYGRLVAPLDLAGAERLGEDALAKLLQWERVGIAAEAAGAAESAIAITVEHVKERHVFGKPIGGFQAIQHRLAQCHQQARATRFLALHAAWTGDPLRADVAATYAQDIVNKLAFDLHQFNGGMGVTAEYKLHFWTYRLRALQAEAGGADGAASAAYDRLWDAQGKAAA
jgi:hypothetical protein